VVCEEKHMGSRAVVVVCKDEDAARSRFGTSDGAGVVYTRTGRSFFREELQAELLERLRRVLDQSEMLEEFETDWFCLDCEILPWSAKAEELLRRQYAAVGAASRPALSEAVAALEGAEERDLDVGPLLTDYRERREAVESYVETYRRYCWPVHSLDDIKVAPFHLLATEGAVHVDKDHLWHLRQLARLCAADDGLLFPTGNMTVDVTNAESVEDGVRWWEEITGRGGEGMVVKPLDFVARGRRGLAQPGIKCRGREYLRIIYGPEYDLPENLDRLRGRRLSAKRSLASREFALGVEALERFVRRDPLYKVHECVFGVLALESEPVDPRL
jgi:protein phosphatase